MCFIKTAGTVLVQTGVEQAAKIVNATTMYVILWTCKTFQIS